MRLIPLKRNPASEKEVTDAFHKTDGELKARMHAYGVCRDCAEGAIFMIRKPPNLLHIDDTTTNPMGLPVCSKRCADGIIAALTEEARPGGKNE